MNRIILLCLTLIAFSTVANAQFNKGSLLIGGELSYSGYSTNFYSNDQNSHTGIFNISIGKAINSNTVAGINLTYSPITQDNYYQNIQIPISYRKNSYTVGVFYRKYKELGKDFYLFGEAGLSYGFSNESGKDSLGVQLLSGSGNSGQINFMPGIAYGISKKFFLEITIQNILFIQYSNASTNYQNNPPGTSKTDQFVVSTSLNSSPLFGLGVGFRLIL